ncbi:MAG: hypothetical protein ACI9N9_001280 [Enterobacterales bacterium]|jgi:hypothetical protein
MMNQQEQAINDLLLATKYLEAEKYAKNILEKDSNNLGVLKLLSIALRSQEKVNESLAIMKTVSDMSSSLIDKELYIFELISSANYQEALGVKSSYMKDPQYRKMIKSLIEKQNVLFQKTHQFYLSYSLVKFKDNLQDLADTIVNDEKILLRVKTFINNLFNRNAFRETSKAELHDPSFLGYAGLSENPFTDANELICLKNYSEFRDAIKLEVINILETENTVPYVKDTGSLPQGLEHLKNNSDWSSLTVFAAGKLLVNKADKLLSLLHDKFELADCKPMGPEVMISILKPGTYIGPHYGISNIKQTLHIPIVLPEGDLAIKIGGIEKQWSNDYPLIFDDTFLHEAWNNTLEKRIVLIVDIWNPDLTTEEKIFLAKALPLISEWKLTTRL